MQHVQVSYCLPQHPSYSKFGSARIMTNELRLATVMARTLQNNNVGIKMEKSEGKRIVWNNYNKYKIKYIRLNTHTHTHGMEHGKCAMVMCICSYACVYAMPDSTAHSHHHPTHFVLVCSHSHTKKKNNKTIVYIKEAVPHMFCAVHVSATSCCQFNLGV